MNQNIKCIPLPDRNENEDGFGSVSDSESESDSTDLPSKCKKINERKTQIEWKSNKRSNWEIPSEYSIITKKISLNGEIPLTRFCSPISFFEIFVNDEIIDLIFEQTKLYNQWRSLNSSAQTVKDIKREEIKIAMASCYRWDETTQPLHVLNTKLL